MRNIFKKFGPKAKLSQEAFDAYYNRLPHRIGVSWYRSGDFIIGDIELDGNKITTQGRDVDDFIFMVNDAVITYNEIPEDYQESIKSLWVYKPPVPEVEKLRNASITNAFISLNKNKENLRVA